MSKKTQKIVVWAMVAIMVGGALASLIVYFIR